MTPAKTETTTGDCYLVFYQPSTACTVQPFAHFECLTPMLYVCHKMHMFFFLLCLLSETESIEPSELKKKKVHFKLPTKPGMVVHTCNPSTQEADAGGSQV
jgi:hypothetical protein